MSRLYGVVLAGGLARRMGGGDKPLVLLAGRPLLAHVVERVAPQVDALAINANGDPARFAPFGLPVVPDGVPGHPGPLAGVLAALDAAAAAGFDTVLSVPGDAPFLPPDLAPRLLSAREAAGAPFACAASAGRTHPVAALWPVAAREELRRALVEDGERKIDRFTARGGCAVADWALPPGAAETPDDPFFNANRPDDLALAEAALARTAL